MSEFEYAELFELLSQGSFNNFVSMSTIVFAYLVTGHLVAKDLPRRVALGVTTLYCLFLIGPITGYTTYFARMHQASREYVEAFPGGWVLAEFPLWPLLHFPALHEHPIRFIVNT